MEQNSQTHEVKLIFHSMSSPSSLGILWEVLISADCYRQSHDAHLIFNAIGGVQLNSSHFRLSRFFSLSLSLSDLFNFLSHALNTSTFFSNQDAMPVR